MVMVNERRNRRQLGAVEGLQEIRPMSQDLCLGTPLVPGAVHAAPAQEVTSELAFWSDLLLDNRLKRSPNGVNII